MKEQARAQRLELERARTAAAQRRQRLIFLGGAIVVAVVVLVVAIVVSTSGGKAPSTNPNSPADKAAAKRVQSLLAGIPQSTGNVLGKASAPVTVTEFGDLECSVCDEFDLPAGVTSPAGVPGTGILPTIIQQDVATGKVKLVYKSLETASADPANAKMWTTQQAAANAAGLQGKGWNYVELFYNEQGAEDTPYVTMSYLEGLAKQIPGLNYSKWLHDLNSDQAIRNQVASDNTEGAQLDLGKASTPTIWIQGPKNDAQFAGITEKTVASELSVIQKAINSAA